MPKSFDVYSLNVKTALREDIENLSSSSLDHDLAARAEMGSWHTWSLSLNGLDGKMGSMAFTYLSLFHLSLHELHCNSNVFKSYLLLTTFISDRIVFPQCRLCSSHECVIQSCLATLLGIDFRGQTNMMEV